MMGLFFVSKEYETIAEFLKIGFNDARLKNLLIAAESNEVIFRHPATCLVGRSDYYRYICQPRVKKYENAWRDVEYSFWGQKWANRKLAKMVRKEMARREVIRAEGRELTEHLISDVTEIEVTGEYHESLRSNYVGKPAN